MTNGIVACCIKKFVKKMWQTMVGKRLERRWKNKQRTWKKLSRFSSKMSEPILLFSGQTNYLLEKPRTSVDCVGRDDSKWEAPDRRPVAPTLETTHNHSHRSMEARAAELGDGLKR